MTTILWDLDGTIQDSEPIAREGTRHGFQQVLGRDPTDAELSQLVGRVVLAVYTDWFGDDLARQLFDVGSVYYAERSTQILCYDGIPKLLTELRRLGFRQGVVSSKRRHFILSELRSKGLDTLFDIIVGQEDTVVHKPHPEPLLLAARLMDVPAEDCVYIGDQPTDIQAAHAAGMKGIAALWGDGTVERLQPAHPHGMTYSPQEIIPLLVKVTSTAW